MQRLNKTIHQIYWSDDTLPTEYMDNIEIILHHHPEWKYILWDEKSCLELLENEMHDMLCYIDKCDHIIQKCDLMRYFILYNQGGLYLDLDIKMFKPFEQILNKHPNTPEIFFKENSKENLVTNSVMFSYPSGYIMKKCIDWLKLSNTTIKSSKDIITTTGPGFLTKIASMYSCLPGASHVILPSEYFEPEADQIDTAVGLHYYAGSWYNDKNMVF